MKTLQDTKYWHIKNSPEDVAKFLLNLMNDDMDKKAIATLIALIARNQLPMYRGDINPAWKFWDDVLNIINPHATEEMNEEFLQGLVDKSPL